MPYTPLDISDPSQAEKARLGAGRIRDLATAVKQRLLGVFIDVDAEPMVLRPDTVGASQISAGAVGNSELAADAVTSDKIAALTIVNGDVADATLGIEKLSGTARGKLIGRVRLRVRSWVGANLIAAHGFTPDWGVPLIPGDYRGKVLVAYWGASPYADLGLDIMKQSCILQPVADATQVGVIIWNQTAFATLDLNGYTIYVDALLEP